MDEFKGTTICAVKKDGKWGSINKAGVQELEPSVNLESSILGFWN